MKIKYFEDTDTLLMTLFPHETIETQDSDENTLIDLDQQGNICSITIEHPQARMGEAKPHFERVAPGSKKVLAASH